MIELYVSTKVKTSCKKITELLSKQGVECQVYENYSSCKTNTDKLIVEHGFCIKIFDLSALQFKNSVWEILKPYLSISCAFVKCDNQYMGCVLNWPHIFRSSVCTHIQTM